MRCKQGDLAIVEESIDGAAVNKIVQCIALVGDHSKLGPIWRCRSKDVLVTEHGGVGQEADFADAWLRPIKPGELDPKTKQKELTPSLTGSNT